MSNHHLLNPALSLKAKGLMSYMLSRPDDWDFTIDGLVRLNKEGTDAIGRILRELEAHGCITRNRVRNKAGKFVDMEYNILERPQDLTAAELDVMQDAENDKASTNEILAENNEFGFEKLHSENPHPENPGMDGLEAEYPIADDRGQINNNIINTLGIKTDEKILQHLILIHQVSIYPSRVGQHFPFQRQSADCSGG